MCRQLRFSSFPFRVCVAEMVTGTLRVPYASFPWLRHTECAYYFEDRKEYNLQSRMTNRKRTARPAKTLTSLLSFQETATRV